MKIASHVTCVWTRRNRFFFVWKHQEELLLTVARLYRGLNKNEFWK